MALRLFTKMLLHPFRPRMFAVTRSPEHGASLREPGEEILTAEFARN